LESCSGWSIDEQVEISNCYERVFTDVYSSLPPAERTTLFAHRPGWKIFTNREAFDFEKASA